MSTIWARWAAGSFRIGEAFLQHRQHRRRPQFPDEVGDLVVPFGELLGEVGEDDLAALRIVADGDADGFEIEAILAVVLLGRARRCSGFALSGSTSRKCKQIFAAHCGG